jgi:membrane fusion protein, macrolide-specific efflux system
VRSTGKKWFARRGTIFGAVIVVLAAAGVATWLATSSSSAAPLISTTTTVQTVATGTITKTVSSTGTIEPANQANLNFGVSGRVTAVDVGVGQVVSAGQALATIDDSSLSASLAEAQANLANDQANLANDQTNGASAAQIASDQASIASAQTQVTSAQTSLSEATLVSTIGGTVAAVNLTQGQQVTGSSSSSDSSQSGSGGSGSSGSGGSGSSGATGSGSGGSGTGASSGVPSSSSSSSSSSAQIVVVSTGSYIVNTSVDSTQVSQLTTGDQATITVSGSTTPVYGTVGTIGLLASTTSGVSTFPVVIDVTGSPAGLFGGSSATVSIITEELQNVIVVPTAAVQFSGNNTTVTLDNNGNKVTQTVQIGAASGGQTQVTSGLAVGDKIYVTEVTFRGGTGTGTGTGLFGRGGGGFGGGGGGGFGGGGGGGFGGGGGGGGFGG